MARGKVKWFDDRKEFGFIEYTENNPVRITDETGAKIAQFFKTEDSGWRSVGAIARQTGLSEEEIKDYIESNQQFFDESPINPGGKELYSLRSNVTVST